MRAIIRLSFVAVILFATHTHALRVYFIGNSLTDQVKYGAFQDGAIAMGQTHSWGRHMIPGTPLLYLWQNPEGGFKEPCAYTCALRDYTWDVITLQAYDWLLAQETEGACNFSNLAKQKSPDVQMYIYAYWPLRSNDYQAAWLKPYQGEWKARHKDYFERLTLASRARLTDMKPMLMIPVGHVMYELDIDMRAGRIAGFTSINEVYSDDTHLNDRGSYIVACTFYATIYKSNPQGFPYSSFSGVTAAYAAAVQAKVWPVVTGISSLSGVTGTTAVSPSRAVHMRTGQVTAARDAALRLNGQVTGAGRSATDAVEMRVRDGVPEMLRRR